MDKFREQANVDFSRRTYLDFFSTCEYAIDQRALVLERDEQIAAKDELLKQMASNKELVISEIDESLMRYNLLRCYGEKVLGLRVSGDHYRYLVEQIVSLRKLTTLQRAYLSQNGFADGYEQAVQDHKEP